jgi:hypothetical protein
LAYRPIDRYRHFRLGPTPRARLRRLRGRGDKMRYEIGLGAAASLAALAACFG